MRQFCLIALLLGTALPSSAADEPAATFPAIPGWSVVQDTAVYTPANLYDLIDGAADLFLSYGFVDLHLAEYSRPDSVTVRVEVYRHNTSTNAFGAYSQERNTDYEFITVGTEGYVADGILNFFAGTRYVKMSTMTHGVAGRQAMSSVAKCLDSALSNDRNWPVLLSVFPEEGKIPHSEIYAAENFLGYRFLRNAFSATYGGNQPLTLFVIAADNEAQARGMLEQYAKAIGASTSSNNASTSEFTDPHSGPVMMARRGSTLVGSMRYGSADEARRMVQSLDERLRRWSAGK